MAPCKVNFYRPIYRSKFWASLLYPCGRCLLTRVLFLQFPSSVRLTPFLKTDPKTFSDLSTNNLKIVSTSSNQKKLNKVNSIYFLNLETNNLASVSFVNNLEK